MTLPALENLLEDVYDQVRGFAYDPEVPHSERRRIFGELMAQAIRRAVALEQELRIREFNARATAMLNDLKIVARKPRKKRAANG